jgi:hypothetical protein
VLDLGAGENGLGDLTVHFSNPPGALAQTTDVRFLDQNHTEPGQGQLAMIGTGSILVGVTTVGFDAMTAAVTVPG